MKENTVNILKEAGWYKGRSVDIDFVVEALMDFNYPVLDTFKIFYEEFADIYFICEIDGNSRKIEFYPDVIEEHLHSIIQEKYTRVTNCLLNPIGSIDEVVLLAIDENGTIYSLYDSEVTIIGRNTKEALDNLCNRPWAQWTQNEKFPYPQWWHEDRNEIMKKLGFI